MAIMNSLIDFFSLNTNITTLPDLIVFMFELFFACMILKIIFQLFFKTIEYLFYISK